MTWADLSGWWREEVSSDPSYERDITPFVVSLLDGASGWILDVGCGEGRLMSVLRSQAVTAVGLDVSQDLLRSARPFGPVVRGLLPAMPYIADDTFHGAMISLVLEHLDDETTLFSELGRVVRGGGVLALVMNHPMYTAPASAPIQEEDEVLWRPGSYFGRGFTDEKAGKGTVRFHHRTTADILNAASAGGWDLDRMVELGATPTQIAAHPPLADQAHIPRLLGCRWIKR